MLRLSLRMSKNESILPGNMTLTIRNDPVCALLILDGIRLNKVR